MTPSQEELRRAQEILADFNREVRGLGGLATLAAKIGRMVSGSGESFDMNELSAVALSLTVGIHLGNAAVLHERERAASAANREQPRGAEQHVIEVINTTGAYR